jgi:hypothetical protein
MDEQENKSYNLDRNSFRGMTFEEADNHYGFWKEKSLTERLNAAFYLIYTMYGVNKHTPVDKTVFSKRKHPNG